MRGGHYMMVRLPASLYKSLKARASEAGVKPRSLAAAYLSALLEIAERKEGGRAMEENISFFAQDIYDEVYKGFQEISSLSSLICGAESASEMTWQKREKAKEVARGAMELLSNAEKDLQELINRL